MPAVEGSPGQGRKSGQPGSLNRKSCSNIRKLRLTIAQIRTIRLPSPRHREGRFAIVTKRGAGCDGPLPASGVLHPTKRRRRTAKSCGPGAATLASIRPACAGSATGARKAVPRGEREVSRQTIARGRSGCPGCTCQIRVRFFTTVAHGAAGAAGARPSPRPLSKREQRIGKTRAKNALRE